MVVYLLRGIIILLIVLFAVITMVPFEKDIIVKGAGYFAVALLILFEILFISFHPLLGVFTALLIGAFVLITLWGIKKNTFNPKLFYPAMFGYAASIAFQLVEVIVGKHII